eukprot:CAMPEP_0171338852 /NCGR_PEP_ID=MMETSP0878-20121228/7578_1 /TAXON_ID=67004 /ORGANISM="Thalassiosira weissflogii, Strain CCMP1336" /LENGTH=823 /DNA_ID=CAMNT_0011840675 /DNA_START=369 /DNA_END=2840 /DNA_ORIENTATION=+
MEESNMSRNPSQSTADLGSCTATHNRSQAIEIAVDAHATRILRAHSPPEACVDSSVGPYVTSILRDALPAKNIGQSGSKWSKTSISQQIPDYDSLIELLESQCYMIPSVAKDVIWEIALVVEKEEVSDSVVSSIHSSFDDNDLPSNRRSTSGLSSGNSSAINARLGRGYRSKSLGSELEYDVNFLGKILQEAMEESSATSPTAVASSAATSGSESTFMFKDSAASCNSSKESNIHDRGGTDGVSLNLALASESNGHESGCLPPLYPASSNRGSVVSSNTLLASSSLFPVTSSNTPTNPHNASSTGQGRNFDPTSTVNSAGAGIGPNIGLYSSYASKGKKERHVSFDETHSTTYSYMTESMVMNTDELSGSVVVSASSQQYVPHKLSDYFDPLEGVLNILNLEEDDDDEEANENSRDPKSHEENYVSELNLDSPQGTNLDGTSGRTSTHVTVDNTQPKSRDDNFPLCRPISSKILSTKSTTEEKSSNSIHNSAFQSQKKSGRKHQKSSKKEEANDLAAALFFRQSRPRSNSLMDHRPRSSPPMRPLSVSSSSGVLSSYNPSTTSSGPILLNLSLGDVSTIPSSSSSATSATSATTASAVFSSASIKLGDATSDPAVISSTTQLLLTLNAHLGHEAASLASELTDGDLNLAQYLIEAARSDTSSGGGNGNRRRPRICRHELHGTCYRSDCPYSHELGGVTCLFWLRGRCRGGNKKGDSPCRFLHGFGERLLDGICEDYLVEQKARKAREEEERVQKQLSKQKEKEERKEAIQTTNLLQHNEWATADRLSQSLPNKTFTFLPLGRGSRSSSPIFGNGCWTTSVVNR